MCGIRLQWCHGIVASESRAIPFIPMKKHSSSARKSTDRARPALHPARSSAKPIPAVRGETVVVALEVTREFPVKSLESPATAAPVELKPVRFGYFNPDAREVFVVGSFNDWQQRANPMKRDAIGDWSVELSLPPGEYHYRLIVDGEWHDDPNAQQTAMNSYGSFDAVVVV